MRLLQQLSELAGVSGNEQEVRQFLVEHIREHVDELRGDALGNLIAIKKPRQSVAQQVVLKVLLTAHMDEVGLMVTHIDSSGLLRFDKIGGVDERVLPAKAVFVGNNKVPGVIGLKPIHLLKQDERKKTPEISSLHIDIGANSKDEAERLVKVGDYVSFATKYTALDGAAKGKAFDNRVGCAILVDLLKAEYPFTLFAVFAAQEEVGQRGARVAAFQLAPDMAIVLEGTVCDDAPKKRDVSSTSVLGKGPAITIMDKSVVADRVLVELLVDTAKRLSIPYQIKQPAIGGTDAGAIHMVREGIRSAVVAVPCRYIHSPVSLISLTDYDRTVLLVKGTLDRLGSDEELVRRILEVKRSGPHGEEGAVE